VCIVDVKVDVYDFYCVPEINMKLYITAAVFPELKQLIKSRSQKKQQEVAHKFLLHTHPSDCSTVATEHVHVIMTVYPHMIGITLLWSSRLLTHEPAQL